MPWLTVLRRVLLPILLAAAARAQCPNSIIAGPPSTYAGDGQPAISAWLFQPSALSLDPSGNLYIADSGNNRIRKVTTDGVIHTVAGPGNLNNPQFVLAAPDGSVYIADSGDNRIAKLTPAGVLNVIAGTGHPGYSGDNGPATAAELNWPTGMALDSKGNLYFADTYNSAIRRIDTSGTITTVPAKSVDSSLSNVDYSLYTPQAVAIGADGTLFIADPGNASIFSLATTGALSPLYTNYQEAPNNLTLLPDGSLLFAQGDLFLLSTHTGTLSYYARAISAANVTMGPSGVYYTSTGNVIYHAATAASEPAVFAGQYYSGDGPDNVSALGPIFGSPGGMIVGPDGSIFVADANNNKVRKILTTGTQRVVATGIAASSLALDPAGNLYAAGQFVVWKISPGGTSQVFAGGGNELIPVVGAPAMPATSVNLSPINGAVTDATGNLYVLSDPVGEQGVVLITRITPAGQLTTIWDSTTVAEYVNEYLDPLALAIDAQGYLLVPLFLDNLILRIGTDGSGIFQTIPLPDDPYAFAASPTGEIFYLNSAGRIKSLKAGATIYNRDLDPTPINLLDPNYQVGAANMIGNILTTPRPGGGVGVLYVSQSSLATDAQGNVYFADASEDVIRRFPAGPCFTARAPQLSMTESVQTISPQPPSYTSTSTTSSTTTTSTSTAAGNSFFSPGELISIYGTGMGPQTGVAGTTGANGLFPTLLSGTQVLIEGVPAPVLYAGDGQINTVIPFSLYGYPQVLLQVEYNGVLSDAVAIAMNASSPIVFTSSTSGQPVAIVLNQDGSLNSPSNPAAPNSVIVFYASGFGLTSPAGIDGHLATVPLPKPVLPVTVSVDGYPATILYAGDVSGIVEGFIQMNVRLPKTVYYGSVLVVVGNTAMQFNISVAGNSLN